MASDAEDLGIAPLTADALSLEDEAGTLATGAWAFAAASDEALDDVADDAVRGRWCDRGSRRPPSHSRHARR